MKPKYLFYFGSLCFLVASGFQALQDHKGLALWFFVAGAVAAFNATLPVANRAASWEDFKRLFGIK